MTRREDVRRGLAVLSRMAVCGIVGVVAYWQHYRIHPATHAVILGILAGLLVVFGPIAWNVVARLDTALDEAKKHENADRVRPVSGYGQRFKRQVVVGFWCAGINTTVVGAIAVHLRNSGSVFVAEIALGYVLGSAILLFGIRMSRLLLNVDDFRGKLADRLRSEERRVATLRELRQGQPPLPKLASKR